MTSAEFILAAVTLQRAGELVLSSYQYPQAPGPRRRRGRARALSADRRGARRMADIAVGTRARSARERRCLVALSGTAGLSLLGDAVARLAMDDADHHPAGTAPGVGGTLSLPVASQLCRGCRRDRRASACSRPSAAGRDLHDPQRGGSRDPHPRRKPRPRLSRDDRRVAPDERAGHRAESGPRGHVARLRR